MFRSLLDLASVLGVAGRELCGWWCLGFRSMGVRSADEARIERGFVGTLGNPALLGGNQKMGGGSGGEGTGALRWCSVG